MSTTAKNAILRALIEGAITELLVRTNTDNVYFSDGTTTLSAKLAEIVTALNAKATTTAMNQAINDLRQELLGDVPVEAYNTFAELAQYIESHGEAADALSAAIGNKADKTTVDNILATVNALGALAKKSAVSESDLDAALKEKVNSAASVKHSHSNKALLDTYTQTNANLAAAVAAKHTHGNQSVLESITAELTESWTGKGKFYAQASQPATLSAGDLWAQIV